MNATGGVSWEGGPSARSSSIKLSDTDSSVQLKDGVGTTASFAQKTQRPDQPSHARGPSRKLYDRAGGDGMRRLCIAAIAGSICGCATSPVSNSDAHDVPDSRMHSHQWLAPAFDTSQLTIKRDSGMMGAACAVSVFMDGEAIADLRTGEKVSLNIRPGKHLFGARATGICGGGSADTSLVSEARNRTRFAFPLARVVTCELVRALFRYHRPAGFTRFGNY